MVKNEACTIFKNYPDALTLSEFAEMLGISRKLASKLIRTGEIPAVKIGREYRIAKVNAIHLLLGKYVQTDTSNPNCWTKCEQCGNVGSTKPKIQEEVS